MASQPQSNQSGKFYIIDLRKEFSGNPYITVWRPGNAGYAYPLPWAGQYTRDEIEAQPHYYHKRRHGSCRIIDRFPVPCEIVEALGIEPAQGTVDGNTGPVLANDARTKAALREARYAPKTLNNVIMHKEAA